MENNQESPSRVSELIEIVRPEYKDYISETHAVEALKGYAWFLSQMELITENQYEVILAWFDKTDFTGISAEEYNLIARRFTE